jgi:uncharacterized protein (DUF58 family)
MGESTVWLKPAPGGEHRLQIMRALALLETGPLPLGELLERAAPALGHHTSLIVITPSMDASWLASLARLMWRGVSPTVLLIDPASFGSGLRADTLANVLAGMGIHRHVLTRDLLARPEARPGWRGQWEWRISATGRAIPLRPPGDTTWRGLG